MSSKVMMQSPNALVKKCLDDEEEEEELRSPEDDYDIH